MKTKTRTGQHIRPTRFPDLGYVKTAPDLWRIIMTEDGAEIGPLYRSKAELLADLERFADSFYGTSAVGMA